MNSSAEFPESNISKLDISVWCFLSKKPVDILYNISFEK